MIKRICVDATVSSDNAAALFPLTGRAKCDFLVLQWTKLKIICTKTLQWKVVNSVESVWLRLSTWLWMMLTYRSHSLFGSCVKWVLLWWPTQHETNHCRTNCCKCFKTKLQCNYQCHLSVDCSDKHFLFFF